MAAPPVDGKVREALSRPQSVIDITTTGRKSGESRRLEIVLHNIDGHLYISGQPSRRRRSWLANLDGNPNLTVHLKLASDALLKTARHMALLSHDADCDQRCPAALDELMTMAIELAAMERILRALMDANREEENLAAARRFRSLRS